MNEPVAAARRALAAATRWRGDRLATLLWWRDAELLRLLGPGLAGLHPDAEPTLVAGVQSSGYLLAPLVATTLRVGMLGIQQDRRGDEVHLLVDDEAITPGARVLLVDDVAETGAQIRAVRELVLAHGADWLGAAVMVAYPGLPELGIRTLAGIDTLSHRVHRLPLST